MPFMHLSQPPARVTPGDTFTVGRYGTVNHIARTVAPSKREKGQTLIAWCGMSGHIPDLYQDDWTARTNRTKRICKNCNWRAA